MDIGRPAAVHTLGPALQCACTQMNRHMYSMHAGHLDLFSQFRAWMNGERPHSQISNQCCANIVRNVFRQSYTCTQLRYKETSLVCLAACCGIVLTVANTRSWAIMTLTLSQNTHGLMQWSPGSLSFAMRRNIRLTLFICMSCRVQILYRWFRGCVCADGRPISASIMSTHCITNPCIFTR